MSYVIGVDLGGTNVRARVFDQNGGEIGEAVKFPSKGQDGTEAIIEAIAKTIKAATEQSPEKPIAVGMAVPGHVDTSHGVIRWSPNFGRRINGVFHHWRNMPIREKLEAYVDIPIYLGNDANLAALGEYKFGYGENSAPCLVMLTLGTGVGGGVVMAPKSLVGDARGPLVLVGGNGGGAELGHTVIAYQGMDCNAGSYGALEAYCSRDAIVSRTLHRLSRGRKSSIPDFAEGDLDTIEPLTVSLAAQDGDELAIEILYEVGTMLGIGIGNFINIFAPSVLAVGGQIAKADELLLHHARLSAQNVAIPSLFEDVKIVRAKQIDHAGILGGAALAIEALKWQA